MAQRGASFGFAMPNRRETSPSPFSQTRQEVLKLLRQRENQARQEQSQIEQEFAQRETLRKQKLRVTLSAWDVAMSKQKKKPRESLNASGASSSGDDPTDVGEKPAAYDVVVAPPVPTAMEAVDDISSAAIPTETASVAPLGLAETPPIKSSSSLTADDLRAHRERFRKKFPFFRTSETPARCRRDDYA